MKKRHMTYQEIYDLKYQELKRLVPPEAHPYLERIRPNLQAIEEKYAPLYAQASAHPRPEADNNFIKVLETYEIKERLDDYVVGQHEAKKVLSQVSFYHMAHLKREFETHRINEDYIKTSILLIGPTGSGKTLLANTLSRILQVPFVKVDATSMTKTGFVGDSIQDAVRELYYITEGNLDKAQSGIILVDEIDKLAGGSREDYVSNSVVTGRGVQQELLRPMENSMIDVFSHTNIHSIREMMQGGDVENKKISTRNILFILAGAFEGIEEVMLKRMKKERGYSIGFGEKQPLTLHDVSLEDLQPQDLIEYGLIPELVGRITYIVPLEKLDQEKLYHVLRDSHGSITRQIEESIQKTTNKRVEFSDASLQHIAAKAERFQTGGRALAEISYRVMNEFLFHLPSLDLEEYTITPEFIEHYLPMTFRLIVRPHIRQAMLKFPFVTQAVEWEASAIEHIVRQLSQRRLVSVHKYISDFMTSWAPIIHKIILDQEKVTISGTILELYDQNSHASNEQIFALLHQAHSPFLLVQNTEIP